MVDPLRVLVVAVPIDGLEGALAPQACATLEEAERLLRESPPQAVLLGWGGPAKDLLAWPPLAVLVHDSAVVVEAPGLDAEEAVELIRAGVQDVLPASDAATRGRALRWAAERARLQRALRRAYATDLATGLPNHPQLLDHMTQLLALREREPAPMALIALRLEGLGSVREALGEEAANVLRRKAAVRLRSALRASDVVASIGIDTFAVLLAWIDAPADGLAVAGKLAQALAQGFSVSGRRFALRVHAGLASFPEHGRDAESLLRRAVGQAATVASVGEVGTAHAADRGPAAAANDDE